MCIGASTLKTSDTYTHYAHSHLRTKSMTVLSEMFLYIIRFISTQLRFKHFPYFPSTFLLFNGRRNESYILYMKKEENIIRNVPWLLLTFSRFLYVLGFCCRMYATAHALCVEYSVAPNMFVWIQRIQSMQNSWSGIFNHSHISNFCCGCYCCCHYLRHEKANKKKPPNEGVFTLTSA